MTPALVDSQGSQIRKVTGEKGAASPSLVFALNGEKVELENADLSMTLNDYIRQKTRFKGTKLACGEGGCGACAVVLSRHDPSSNSLKEFTANSCLTPLGAVHGHSVLTSEGLGNSKKGFHSVQERLAGFHASQCGFCTPGMAVSIYAKLRQKGANEQPNGHANEHANGSHTTGLSADEAESALQGNLCRCTGYRPILDACKSFATGIDMEDLGLCTFDKDKGLPKYDSSADPQFPDFLKPECISKLQGQWGDGQEWKTADSLSDVFKALQEADGKDVKLVVGNTSRGYYKDDKPQVYIDVRAVPELSSVKQTPEGLSVGGATTLADLISHLDSAADSAKSPVYPVLAKHLRKVAGNHVRNVASVAGNLVLSQRGFPSDVATVLLGAGAMITIGSEASGQKTVTVEEFLAQKIAPNEVIVTITLPAGEGSYFYTNRAAPRPSGNAVAYLNAAFKVNKVTESKELQGVTLAYGAFSERAVRAKATEKVLESKPLSPALILEASKTLKDEIIPKDAKYTDYKQSLAVSFLFEFLAPIWQQEGLLKPLETPSSSGNQRFSTSDELYPVSAPIKKLGAELQASGEAVFTDDIPLPEGTLFGAYVTSTHAHAKILKVDASEALAMEGVAGYVSLKDIPEKGQNIGMSCMGMQEPLFPEEYVEYVGHPLGVIVADSLDKANDAAAKVKVEYEVKQPILTIDEAQAANAVIPWAPFIPPMFPKHGDFEAGWNQAEGHINGAEVYMASQQHFFMENNVAMAVPDEGGNMTVYTSCQGPDLVQETVAKALGLRYHCIRAVTRRVGGGFGGKATRASPIAASAALAAHKLGRPVKMSPNRNLDMMLTGGRCPTKAVYDVGFKKDGTITAVDLKVYFLLGWHKDLTDFEAYGFSHGLHQYNFRNLKTDMVALKANLSSKTSMRAPGEPQGVFVCETIIEHVAAETGLTAEEVRAKNMFSREELQEIGVPAKIRGEHGFTLPRVWKDLQEGAKFAERKAAVEKFNAENKWRKRGISLGPMTYQCMVFSKPARVSVLADASVVVDNGGVELGQGLLTKVLQTASYALSRPFAGVDKGGVPMDRIRIVDNDSIVLANGGITGGSTTSEASCEAIRRACELLNDRLAPVLEQLKKEKAEKGDNAGLAWDELVQKAMKSKIDMSAGTHYFGSTPDGTEPVLGYFNFGASISEVEIDVLTGSTTVLQSDILYDCGRSMNPAVDIGQIEGAYVQGLGFYLWEEVEVDETGNPLYNSTWTYKVPTYDTIPRRLNVELLSSAPNEKGVLSSKASGEPPLLMAVTAHCAVRHAIVAARKEHIADPSFLRLDVPLTMDKVKLACGVDTVEKYLGTLTQ